MRTRFTERTAGANNSPHHELLMVSRSTVAVSPQWLVDLDRVGHWDTDDYLTRMHAGGWQEIKASAGFQSGGYRSGVS